MRKEFLNSILQSCQRTFPCAGYSTELPCSCSYTYKKISRVSTLVANQEKLIFAYFFIIFTSVFKHQGSGVIVASDSAVCSPPLCCHMGLSKLGWRCSITFSLRLWSYFGYLSTICDIINSLRTILDHPEPSFHTEQQQNSQTKPPPPHSFAFSLFPPPYPGSFRNSVKILFRLCFIFPWMLIIFTCLIKDSRAFP